MNASDVRPPFYKYYMDNFGATVNGEANERFIAVLQEAGVWTSEHFLWLAAPRDSDQREVREICLVYSSSQSSTGC